MATQICLFYFHPYLLGEDEPNLTCAYFSDVCFKSRTNSCLVVAQIYQKRSNVIPPRDGSSFLVDGTWFEIMMSPSGLDQYSWCMRMLYHWCSALLAKQSQRLPSTLSGVPYEHVFTAWVHCWQIGDVPYIRMAMGKLNLLCCDGPKATRLI